VGFYPITASSSSGGQDDPAAYGLAMWTCPLFGCAGTLGPNAETLILVLARAPVTATIGHLGAWIDAAGVTPGPGVNGLAVYSAAGVLLAATADMTTAFEGTTYAEGALTASVPIVAGTDYYLANPAFVAGPGLVSYPVIRTVYPSVAYFGQTSFPASVSIAGGTPAGTPLFLTAGT
jgi:hypothetical protein